MQILPLVWLTLPQAGMTPVHYAAGYGHLRAVLKLLDAGAAVEAINKVRPPPIAVDGGSCMLRVMSFEGRYLSRRWGKQVTCA
jgi:ankyrin repeat protein